ncbi:DNA-binding protein WhiA [Thermoanaerobacter pentosaceus]|uniref:Probable cell division protein WhiA n=1 Tax=Thermoanaerobacter pentosaceus TaxID=694059 RepID=A0ABT9M304_9THEO|nr:DNA-binding protein WhiA [Thermoanaerobacter pentosaceus]MDP9750486.1 DNA-binding protein WhiA [Thermoanaerobacter pentosaceus]
MSFSSNTKDELAKIYPEDKESKIAELAALIRTIGSVSIYGNGKISLTFTTENASVARLVFKLIKDLFGIIPETMVRRGRYLKKTLSYLIFVPDTKIAEEILGKVKILNYEKGHIKLNYGIDKKIVKNTKAKKAYLRGAFLGGGSISDPEKAYHMEFITHNLEHGKDLSKLINSFDLNSKVIARKNSYVVYLKEGEQIVDVLNIIGAHSALLNLENIRVYKEMRNNVNRIVNCETANLTKTINASLRQIESINYIKETVGLDYLPPNLKEVAELRINYPDLSLKELGQMLVPPVGKSGVNHRLRKIEEISNKLKERRVQ